MKGIFMSRRKKKNDIGQVLVLLIIAIIKVIFNVLSRIVIFLFDLITFYTADYKEKSGYSFLKMYFDKGNYGEFTLYRKMIRVFGKKSVLTNIYLDNENTDLTEIDVLAISRRGIYVFEMKNYSGYIYGSESDKHWTQVLNKWNKNKFYNPLRQNYAHTKAVENYLQVNEEILVPIIVFSNNSKLSKINISPNQNVFQYKDAIKYVKNYEKKADVKISENTKEEYLVALLNRCNMSDEVKLKHIEEVKNLIKKSS
jgi:hypothetical protein